MKIKALFDINNSRTRPLLFWAWCLPWRAELGTYMWYQLEPPDLLIPESNSCLATNPMKILLGTLKWKIRKKSKHKIIVKRNGNCKYK